MEKKCKPLHNFMFIQFAYLAFSLFLPHSALQENFIHIPSMLKHKTYGITLNIQALTSSAPYKGLKITFFVLDFADAYKCIYLSSIFVVFGDNLWMTVFNIMHDIDYKIFHNILGSMGPAKKLQRTGKDKAVHFTSNIWMVWWSSGR